MASYTGPVLYVVRPDNKTAPVEAWGNALAFSGCEVQDEYKWCERSVQAGLLKMQGAK